MMNKHDQSVLGFIYATGAFLIWGLSPIIYKALAGAGIPPFEVLMHRIVWSFFFLMVLLPFFRRWRAFVATVKNGRNMAILLGTTLLVSFNWFVFIWAVKNHHVVQASLGYFINPLVSVVLGMLFLRERLRRLQALAALLAGTGVLYMTIALGQVPWISLSLAVTFGFYGLIRKVAPVEALEGLAVETLILFAPAVVYLLYLDHQGSGAFFHLGWRIDLLLMATIVFTAVPLLLFTLGTRRLTLTTLGFLQYLAPSGNLLLAVFVYHEPFSMVQGTTFALIWTALALFSWDAIRVANYMRRLRHGLLQ